MARRCRLTSFFRIFVIIPIWIVLGIVAASLAVAASSRRSA